MQRKIGVPCRNRTCIPELEALCPFRWTKETLEPPLGYDPRSTPYQGVTLPLSYGGVADICPATREFARMTLSARYRGNPRRILEIGAATGPMIPDLSLTGRTHHLNALAAELEPATGFAPA